MNEVFKISLPGNDVKSASLSELVVDSVYPSPKVDTLATPPHAGIIRLNWQSTGITVGNNITKLLYRFQHNYNYIPTVLGTYAFDNGSTKDVGVLPFQYGGLGMITLDSDSTYINLKYFSFDLASTAIPPFLMQIRFYVFAERGLL